MMSALRLMAITEVALRNTDETFFLLMLRVKDGTDGNGRFIDDMLGSH